MPSGVYPRKNTPWNKKVCSFIKSAASEGRTIESVRKEVNETFKLDLTYQQMKGFYYRNDLPFRHNFRHNVLLTDEQAEYMASIIPGKPSKEVAWIMNEKFGIDLKASQVQSWKKNHKCPSGYDTKCRPGQPSWITGRKFPGHTNSGCWGAGHIAFNNVPIGTIRKHSKYWMIKVRDGKLNDNWVMLHHYIWEQEHGPVPEGHRLLFRDGDPDHVELSNIVCVDTKDAAIAVMKYGMTRDSEINDSIIAVSKLQRKIRNRQEEKQ